MKRYTKLLVMVLTATSILSLQAETTNSCQADTLKHATSISLGATQRDELIKILNRSLATLTDLSTATKNAHWNVKGGNFYALHLLFDDIVKGMSEFNDTIAERVAALGGTAAGTLQQAVSGTTLEQYPTNIFSGMAHVEALAQRFAKAGAEARQAIKETETLGDSASSDIFIDITRTLDKYLWFLEAHLQ
jgi:starvation-inducible DNA-binding protein